MLILAPLTNVFDASIWFIIPILCIQVPVIVLFIGALYRKRTAPGHCQTCGYNLTGNVSGICSECGEPVNACPVCGYLLADNNYENGICPECFMSVSKQGPVLVEDTGGHAMPDHSGA